MLNIQYTTSPGVPPRSMAEEFLSHKNGSEWWYCTGCLHDESNRVFSFQFTLSKVIVYGFRLQMLMGLAFSLMHTPSLEGYAPSTIAAALLLLDALALALIFIGAAIWLRLSAARFPRPGLAADSPE